MNNVVMRSGDVLEWGPELKIDFQTDMLENDNEMQVPLLYNFNPNTQLGVCTLSWDDLDVAVNPIFFATKVGEQGSEMYKKGSFRLRPSVRIKVFEADNTAKVLISSVSLCPV